MHSGGAGAETRSFIEGLWPVLWSEEESGSGVGTGGGGRVWMERGFLLGRPLGGSTDASGLGAPGRESEKAQGGATGGAGLQMAPMGKMAPMSQMAPMARWVDVFHVGGGTSWGGVDGKVEQIRVAVLSQGGGFEGLVEGPGGTWWGLAEGEEGLLFQIAARLIRHVTGGGNGSNAGEPSNGSNGESRDRRGGFLAGDAPLLASKGVLAWLLAASREVPMIYIYIHT